MKYLKCTGLLFLLIACASVKNNKQAATARIQITGTAQGTTYSIIYYASDSIVRKKQADSIFISIDSSLSIYKPYSLISRFNGGTDGIQMDKHLETVVRKSIAIGPTGSYRIVRTDGSTKSFGSSVKTIQRKAGASASSICARRR